MEAYSTNKRAEQSLDTLYEGKRLMWGGMRAYFALGVVSLLFRWAQPVDQGVVKYLVQYEE